MNETTKYYDGIAEGYDALHKEEQLKKFKIIKEYLNKNNYNKQKLKCLDVGCGTCFSFDFFDYDMYGTEPSKKMVYQHSNYKELIQKKRIIIEPAEKIKDYFKENFFDIVLCITAIHHFDKNVVFQAIKKVSKQDAIIIFSVLKSKSSEKLKSDISNSFKIRKTVDEGKDIVFFCTMQ